MPARCLKAMSLLLVLVLFLVSQPGVYDARAHSDPEQVPDSPFDVHPLLVGSRVPNITLMTVDGEPVHLGATIADKPTVLVFYRGGW